MLEPGWTEGWSDAGRLIRDSERLSGITRSLNLEDCDKPFLLRHPCAGDFERLVARAREDGRVYAAHGLDSRFDSGPVWRRMRVLARQLAPRPGACAAYCELKSQLCLERSDFFDEVYSVVEARLRSGACAAEKTLLMNLVCDIRRLYDVYLS